MLLAAVGCRDWIDRAGGRRCGASSSCEDWPRDGRWFALSTVSPQAALMVSLIWKYYSVPVAVVPSKWITPLDRLVAFPTRVAGKSFLGNIVGDCGEA